MKHGANPHSLNAERILEGLYTRRVGRRVIVLPEVGSTNTYVLDSLAGRQEAALEDGTVVFAEHQTAGRGRLGRAWYSPRGASLMFTVLLRQDAALERPSRVIMTTSLAVVEGIERVTDVEPVIRWPNDVYVGTRKLAGILVESRTAADGRRYLAVGVGVNCLQHAAHFPPEVRDRATSLDIESADAIDRTVIAQSLLRAMDGTFAGSGIPDDAELIAKWQRHSHDLHARVELMENGETFSGRVVDVHPEAGLILQLDTGARRHFDPATTSRVP